MANIQQYDPRHCEHCGDAIDNGHEQGPFGDYLFLCGRCDRNLRNPAPPKIALAVFIGVQPGFADIPAVALFNLQCDISGNGHRHCKGSTVTRFSVAEAGWQLPGSEIVKAQDALLNHMAQRRNIHQKEAA